MHGKGNKSIINKESIPKWGSAMLPKLILNVIHKIEFFKAKIKVLHASLDRKKISSKGTFIKLSYRFKRIV